MCGIAGYIDFNKTTPSETIGKMVRVLRHRGPADKGAENYTNTNAAIGFAQARLSIIDLSDAGHQPMHYNNLSIVFNGEIYNYKEIKLELENLGHHFVSNSDTEVILHAYEQWGTNFVHRCIGMFAIVIYNRNKQKILLLRDRAGVKPLYYYWNNGLFLFASELKSFFVHPGFAKEINSGALDLYFSLGYIPAPYSIFNYSHKVEAGKLLILNLDDKSIAHETYWNINDYYSKPRLNYTYQEAKSQLHEVLISACN